MIETNTETVEEKPPFFNKWANVYIFVISYLILLIGFFFYLTNYFA
jgi:hypothetical protein